MSDEDIGQGQSLNRLTVCVFRKRKCIEELTITSDDSDDEEDKVTTKEKTKQTTPTIIAPNDSHDEEDKVTTKEKKKQTTPRIRKTIKCTECGIPQKNIWRHMKSQHSMHKDRTEDIVVSPKGYITYICPATIKIKGFPPRKCGKVTKRLRDHLLRTHHITNGSAKLSNLMRKAEPFRKTYTAGSPKRKEGKVKTECKDRKLKDMIVISSSEDEDIKKIKVKQEPIDLMDAQVREKSAAIELSSDSDNSICDADDCESMMYGPTQRVVVDEATTSDHEANQSTDSTNVVIFYQDSRIKAFVGWLQENEFSRKNAMQIGAEAFHVWKSMDITRKVKGLLEMNKLKSWVDKSLTEEKKGHCLVVKYLSSVAKLINFLITKHYIVGKEVQEGEQFQDHISWVIKLINIGTSDDVGDDQKQKTQEPDVESNKPMSYRESCDLEDNLETDKVEEIDTEVKIEPDTHEASSETNSKRLIKAFIKWMQETPRLYSVTGAKQHAYQAFQMWNFMSENGTIQGLLEKTRLNAWTDKALTDFAPGTISSYLGSAEKLIVFLLDTSLICYQEEQRARRFIDHLSSTKKLLSKKIKIRRTVIETEEIQTMLLPADMSSFLLSDAAKNCQELALSPPIDIVPSQFYDVRDFILLRIFQTNAQRPMAVRNITENIVRRAKITENTGAVVAIADHKTSSTGPVMIALSPDVFRMVKNFIAMCKRIPDFPVDQDRSIFVSYPKPDGTVTEMTTSHVNKSIQRIWNRGPVTKHLNATRVRKATTTCVRAAYPESRNALAKHMTHSLQTADRHYALHDQREMATPVSNLIQSVMENSSPGIIETSLHWPRKNVLSIENRPKDRDHSSNPPNDNNDPKEGEEKCSGQADSEKTVDLYPNSDEIYQPPESPLNRCNIIEDEIETQSSDAYDDDGNLSLNDIKKSRTEQWILNSKRHGRRTFSEDEARQLLEICKINIDQTNISKPAIKERLQGSEEGRALVDLIRKKDQLKGKDVWKVIVDRIRTEIKKKKRQKSQLDA